MHETKVLEICFFCDFKVFRRNFRRMVLFAVILYLIVPFAASGQSVSGDASSSGKTILRLDTMDLPPYGWEDAQKGKHGIAYELIQEIGIQSGMKFTNKIYPFARMLDMLKEGDLDLILSLPHQAALEAGDKLAEFVAIDVIAGTKD